MIPGPVQNDQAGAGAGINIIRTIFTSFDSFYPSLPYNSSFGFSIIKSMAL